MDIKSIQKYPWRSPVLRKVGSCIPATLLKLDSFTWAQIQLDPNNRYEEFFFKKHLK